MEAVKWINCPDSPLILPANKFLIFAVSDSSTFIVPLTAFNSVISAFPINALFIVASAAINFSIFALITFKSSICATPIIASSILAVLTSKFWVLIDNAYKSLTSAFCLHPSLITACSVTSLFTLFVVLPLLEKLFLFLVSPFAPISEVNPPV